MKDYIRKNSSDNSVYQATRDKDGRVNVFPQGGGFARLMTEAEFTKTFIEKIGAFPIRRATVTADFLPDDMVLACIGSGRRWNGWGMPMFERHVIEQIQPFITNECGDPILSWDGETLLIESYEYNPDLPVSEDNYQFERYAPSLIAIGNTTITVWTVGDGWTWNTLNFDEATPQ